MTSGEEVDVHAFVEQVMADPMTLLQGILQQAVVQLFDEDSLNGGGNTPPEELVATVLGNRVAQMFVDDGSSAVATSSGGTDRDEAAHDRHYEELVARNVALADALGACECWGRQFDCPLCLGVGAPGWILPDKRLFAAYVRPAVRAVSERTAPRSGIKDVPEDQRKENEDTQGEHPSVKAAPRLLGSAATTRRRPGDDEEEDEDAYVAR